MSFLLGNPLTRQGNLNRILPHVLVANFPQLNVTSPFMAKSQVVVTFDGPFVNQIPTATGIVPSPEPFVMAQVVVSLLRSQSLWNLWVAQTQVNSVIGQVTAYSDSNTFGAVTLQECAITEIEPGAFDGGDPSARVTIRGKFITNNDMWL